MFLTWRRPTPSVVVAAALASILAPLEGEALTGDEIIEKMQESFGKHKTFSVSFEKDFYWALLDTRKKSRKGKMYTRRPDQFRVELDSGDLIVASGDGIWNYSRQNRQVVVSDFEGDFKTPWEILVDYSDSYRPIAVIRSELDGRPCYELTLAPAVAEPQNAQIKIWVDRKKWHLLQVKQVEVNDNITTYRLSDHKTNKKLDDALFDYTPPDGVQMIDRREPAPPDDR